MSSTQSAGSAAAPPPRPGTISMNIEAVAVPVTDVDRAKAFYARLGWREDNDAGGGGYRVVQFTPPGSGASVIFGSGVTSDAPGSIDSVLLVVDDIEAAREDLVARGVDVTEAFHDAHGSLGGGWHPRLEGRAPGRDPENRSYGTYASFEDPDGNKWLLQEIGERLPGRV